MDHLDYSSTYKNLKANIDDIQIIDPSTHISKQLVDKQHILYAYMDFKATTVIQMFIHLQSPSKLWMI